MRSISFAGTAKNTGKTTTCLHVMDKCRAANLRLALTSIGFDGEMKDNVTGLPKPRCWLQAGDLVATADRCLKNGSAGWKILRPTGIQTVLGEVVLAQVTEPGLVILAGPNRRRDLEVVLDLLAGAGTDLALVDGALNRLAPMICTNGLVLSTGASFDQDIPALADHARALCSLFQQPISQFSPSQKAITLGFDGNDILETGSGSLLSEDALQWLAADILQPLSWLAIPNACDPRLLRRLLEIREPMLKDTSFVFGNPLKLVASGDPRTWADLIQNYGLHFDYLETLPLRLMTINPFFPHYQPATGMYEPDAVDKQALLAEIRRRVSFLPTADLRQPPAPDILNILQIS